MFRYLLRIFGLRRFVRFVPGGWFALLLVSPLSRRFAAGSYRRLVARRARRKLLRS